MNSKLLKLTDIFILLISALIVIAFNATTILNYISGDTDTFSRFTDLTDNVISNVGSFIGDNIFTPNVTTVLIWAAFGLVTYFFVSFLKIELQDVLKVFNLHGYVKPKNTKNYGFINLVLELLVTIVLGFLLLIWIIYSTTVLIPTSSSLLLVSFYESSSVFIAVVNALLSVYTVFIVFFLPILLYRIAKLILNKLSH